MKAYIAGVGPQSIKCGLDYEAISQIMQCNGFETLPQGGYLTENVLLKFDALALAPGHGCCPEASYLLKEAQRLGRIVYIFDENGFYE